MMPCPDCNQRQWRYDEITLTCKNGHRHLIGEKPRRTVPLWSLPIAAAAPLAIDLLTRTIL